MFDPELSPSGEITFFSLLAQSGIFNLHLSFQTLAGQLVIHARTVALLMEPANFGIAQYIADGDKDYCSSRVEFVATHLFLRCLLRSQLDFYRSVD